MEENEKQFDTPDFFKISVFANGSDFKIFEKVINQGIDSHLEAFTKSRFILKDNRYNFHFHVSELKTLIRRLNELGSEEAEQWATDIQEYEQTDN